ncbi:ABC transporter transmembrane region-domain-containing protein [Jimgerdemannia flammicorona]|uniref:ABC transporter transmembrane region-domain-containing protein n=1 Tax=Jimgerdemannia flammicorona TaxID=994334 RepID=A0A433QBP5_9FUNG|nr:ABC transporter transmembrane region-domain-containing protein [Jimgerdemannia flammicorona]
MVPNLFLLVTGIFRFWKLGKRDSFPAEITSNWHYYLKMILVSLLFLVNASYLAILLQEASERFHNIQVYAVVANLMATLFALVLHHFEFTRSRLSSTVLLFYWLLVIIVDGVKLRTLIGLGHHNSELGLFMTFTTSYILSFCMFVLESISKPKSEYLLIDEDQNECPEETANIFSRLTFHWMTPLMKLGYQKYLTMDDLWNLKCEDQSKIISDSFQNNWQKEMQKPKPSLLRVLIATFGSPFAFAAIFKGLQDALQFTQPILLRELMKWVNSYSTDAPEPGYIGVFIAVAMLLTALTQTMLLHQYFQLCFVTGMRIRAGLVTAIYRKALVLSNASRQQSTVGEIVNHMSVDAQRLMDLCTYFHIVWSGPFQIVLALYFLHQTMGPSIWAGVAILVLAIPINTYLAKRMRTYQKIQMSNKDARIKLMISFIRNDLELVMLRKIGVLSAIQNLTWASIPFFVSLSSFAVYIAISPEPLTSQVAFVAISLFNLLQFPLTVFPNVISSTIEASVSLYRIEAFLVAEELNPDAVKREEYQAITNDENLVDLIEVKHGTFRWSKESEFVLEDINLTVKKGQLMAIVGRVGAGKSSLISALLGDMVKSNGDAIMRGNVAYVPQQAMNFVTCLSLDHERNTSRQRRVWTPIRR